MKSTEAAHHLRVAENITELVGATPMLHLRRLVPAGAADVYAKLEYQANPEFHERTTAVEIFDQMEGRIDAVVIGVGTGGTFSGVARYMKNRLKNVRCIAVETEGSVLGGGPKGNHKVEGIGASF